MSDYLELALKVWLWSFIVVPVPLYIWYGSVMSSVRARDLKVNPSPPWVAKLDLALAIPAVLLDGYYNAFCLPFLCVDPRPRMAFKMLTYRGVTFPFFELMTERLSRYSEGKNEWVIGRMWARVITPLLDAKDPKGWHIRKESNVTH